jgi:hypothetical protein
MWPAKHVDQIVYGAPQIHSQHYIPSTCLWIPEQHREICFRNEDVYRVKRRMSVTYPQVFFFKKKEEERRKGNFWRYFPTLYHYSHKPHSRPSLFISQRCDQMILLWKEQDYKEINEIMALRHRESLALANMTTTKWENRADHLCINSSPNRTTHKLHRDLSNETMALKWKRQITINTTELTSSRSEHQLWLLEIQMPITQISKA